VTFILRRADKLRDRISQLCTKEDTQNEMTKFEIYCVDDETLKDRQSAVINWCAMP